MANIKGRDEIVALFFAVAAAWLTWRSARSGAWSGAAAGAVCMGLGCLAKETAFTWLAVIPAVLLLFPAKEPGSEGTADKLPWGTLKFFLPSLGAALVYLAVRSAILPAGSDAPILELMNNPFVTWTRTAWREVPDTTRLATGFHTLLLYLKLSFLPVGLVHDYYPTSHSAQDLGRRNPVAEFTASLGVGRVRSAALAGPPPPQSWVSSSTWPASP